MVSRCFETQGPDAQQAKQLQEKNSILTGRNLEFPYFTGKHSYSRIPASPLVLILNPEFALFLNCLVYLIIEVWLLLFLLVGVKLCGITLGPCR